METFEVLSEKIDAAKSGQNSSLPFYNVIWNRVVHLSSVERKHLIEKLENLNEQTPFGQGALALFKGMSLVFDADFSKAIEALSIANILFDSIEEFGGKVSANNLLSISYRSVGQLDKAQSHMQVALKTVDLISPKSIFRYFRPITFYQAGELNIHSKNYELAREYYEKGMQYVSDNPETEGRLLSGLGGVLMFTDEWEKAIECFNRGLVSSREGDNSLIESKILSDMANYYFKKKDYQLALEYQNQSLEIRKKKSFANAAITNYIQLAEIYFILGKLDEAIKYGTMAAEESAKLNVMIKLYEAHDILAKVYEKAGQMDKAFSHFKQYHKYKEEVHNLEAIKKVEQLRSNHKMEIMTQEKEIFRLRNVELKLLLDEITDSFRYARRIQTSLLPTEIYIEKTLKRLKG
ncbi:MAG TPA: tetratricopeptide repeat protein [Bacteroidia bacterium]|jgi:tetratricopeptide (TPR) repeat protein|nr:tetratricopeptide repeat protein [Bacteroidia bacterium]